jgi:hypothetical protein
LAPPGAETEGFTIRQTSGEKDYTCPGCQQIIPSGTRHLVVFPDGQSYLRQHWHTPCWERERKLIR